jgi:RsiW-degrading membrane proteinase PrsW (M82 family)
MQVCPRCGAIVDENDDFCVECGLNLTTKDTLPPSPSSDYTPPPQPPQKANVIGNIFQAFANLFSSRPPLVGVSEVAYEKLPPPRVAQSWKLLIIAVALFAGFYFLEFGEQAHSIIDGNLMYFVSTYAVAFLFLLWVYRSDKYERDPFRFILALFAWGVFSGLLAGTLNAVFGPGFEAMFGNEALVAPFVEEPLKALGLYMLVRHKIWGKEFNSPLDGVVYGFAAGLGFFAMENFQYFLHFDESVLIYRSVLCWGHGVWVGTTGLWLAIAKVKRGRLVIWDLLPGLLVATTLHFLWNGWTVFLGSFSLVPMLAQIVHQLWYTRKMIKEALRDDILLGYDAGMAPI